MSTAREEILRSAAAVAIYDADAEALADAMLDRLAAGVDEDAAWSEALIARGYCQRFPDGKVRWVNCT